MHTEKKLVVQKFGGTSVATIERFRCVAQRIKETLNSGNQVVIVVSAMSGVTNDLINLSHSLNSDEGNSEYDVVVSSGEQVSAGLMAMALREIGISARSFLAWQLPILTDDSFGYAEIKNINTEPIIDCLNAGVIPVIGGFHGINKENRLTTLGRGGSDLTAVALAAFLKVNCETYKDVDGVYTADPDLVTQAKRLEIIGYKEMLELAAQGSNVLQARSVEYAMKHNVQIKVASSFINAPGTIIGNFPDVNVCGITLIPNLTPLKVLPSCESKKAAELLDQHYIRSELHQSDCLVLSKKDIKDALQILRTMPSVTEVNTEIIDASIARVSIVGNNATLHSVDNIHSYLKSVGIRIKYWSKTSTRVSVVVANDDAKKAVQTLHKALIA